MATVKLAGVGKRYENAANPVDAVENVDLVIDDGEFVVLVGPSGCGKTTILRMIAGLEPVSTGKIFIGDECVNQVAPKDRDVAMVFQDFALYPHMSVAKNLAFPLTARAVAKSEIEKRIDSVARMLDLTEVLQRYPQELSGGQQQRVAVGRAIVREPGVYLFDEPLSNLDTKLRFRMRSGLKRIHTRLKTTTIHVTHDQEEAMVLGDKIVVMNLGKIHQCGTPLELYRKPANRFVAEFIGTPGMNFVDGEIRQAENGQLTFIGNESGTSELVFPQERFANLAVGAKVTMGIRPEDLVITTGKKSPPDGFQRFTNAIVEFTELTGPSIDVHLRTDRGNLLTCRQPSRAGAAKLRSSDDVKLWLDPHSAHFFQPGEFGERLSDGLA